MKKVDQFFKDKLENHSIAPPERAWSKLESKISKKNNVIAWRIAAAILLMGALISALLWSQKNVETEKSELAEKSVQKEIKKTNPESVESKTKTKEQKSLAKSTKVELTKNIPLAVEAKKQEPIKPKIKLEETEEALAQQEDVVQEKIKMEATVKPEIASTQQKPIKLEFTLEDVSEESVATTHEVKNSGLKKVLTLARELKHGEGPITNLRDKKNELLAHNFITGKTKNQ